MVIVYVPPSYTAGENANLLAVLEHVTCDKEVMLTGDLSLPGISWPGIGSYAPVGHGPPLSKSSLNCLI